jgi:hypothetical protein
MTRLIVNPEIKSQLLNLHGYAELCDDSGQLLGYFMPKCVDLDNPPSPEELDRLESQPGRSLAEIIRDLERLT